MPKYSLIENPYSSENSFGRIKNLNIPRAPQLALIEAGIYLFRGFHNKGTGFGLMHIQHEHENEIRNLGFIDHEGRTLITKYVVSIVRPGTKLYHTGESWKRCRMLAWNRSGMGILEFRGNHGHKLGKHWSIITAYSRGDPYGEEVGTIL